MITHHFSWQIRHFWLLMLIAGLSLTSFKLSADNLTQQRWQFLNALEALETENWEDFQTFSFGLQNYPLYHYLRYQELYPHLEYTPASEVEAYLKQYGDTWYGNSLRQKWLKNLARQKDWSNYLRFYTPQSSKTLQCYQVQARLMSGQSRRATIEAAKKLWLVDHSQASACDPVFEYLYQTGHVTDSMLWQRIAMVMKKGRITLARALGKRFTSPTHQDWFALWQEMHYKPEATLTEFAHPDLPIVRQIAIHGIKRLAIKQFTTATEYWESLQQRYAFSMSEIGEVQRELALASVKHDHPESLKWLTAVHKDFLTDKLNETRITFALAKQNWSAVEDFITQLSPNDEDNLRWQYWLGRAYEQQGRVVQARQIFEQLAQVRDYYGFLAANRIGSEYKMQHRPIKFTPTDKIKLMRIPGIAAAYEFLQLSKLPYDNQQQWLINARREWHYTIDKFSNDQKAVAAALANRWGWYDRALVTAAKAGHYHDLEIRFPLAFYQHLEAGARTQNIDLAWVYGIVRQESAFMDKVSSHAGALGLMQIMPATGHYVAKKIGLKLNNTQDILDIDTNISLGTSYLRQMLDKFNGNYMLATAAYNAGPNRAKRWAKERGCLPADLWVEMIPFKETRKYVRRVLFYTTIFESRLGRQPRPIRLRLSSEEHCTLS
jgi:soluble lytic murein transglycosylase